MSDSSRPHGLYSPWNSPGQNTGVGSLSLLQGIFPTQGWTQASYIAGRFFTSWAMKEAPIWSEVMVKKLSAQFPSTREMTGVSSSWNGFASQPSALSFMPSCPCWLQRKLLRRGHPPERLPSGEEDSPLRLLTSLFAVNRPGSSLLAQGHGLNMPERHVSRKSRSASQQAPRSPSKYQIK